MRAVFSRGGRWVPNVLAESSSGALNYVEHWDVRSAAEGKAGRTDGILVLCVSIIVRAVAEEEGLAVPARGSPVHSLVPSFVVMGPSRCPALPLALRMHLLRNETEIPHICRARLRGEGGQSARTVSGL